MTKIFSFTLSLALVLFTSLGWKANAQPCHTALFQAPPGSAAGDEAVLISSDGCTPAGWTGPWETLNFSTLSDLEISEWTIFGLGCNLMHAHTLLRFDQMITLPPTAVITHAELRLNGIPSSLQNTLGNTQYPGTPFFPNDGTVYMVDPSPTNNWLKPLVTWNTAPATSPAPIAPIAPSITEWNDNYIIDVTGITQQIWVNMNTPGLMNNGYLLKLNATNYYRNLMWASSNNRFALPSPALYIEYYTCDATFTYSATSPNSFSFTAHDPASCFSYVWDYGDGSAYGSGSTTSHTYSAPGTYTVCLMMEDASSNIICKYCTTVTVTIPTTRQAPGGGTTSLTMDNIINIVNVSPNPAQSEMAVGLFLLQDATLHCNVYDMQGRVVMQNDNTVGSGSQKISLNIGKLAPGTYLLELGDGHTTSKAKFTKE